MSLGPLVHEQRLVLTVLTVLFNLLPYLTATIFFNSFFPRKIQEKIHCKTLRFFMYSKFGTGRLKVRITDYYKIGSFVVFEV